MYNALCEYKGAEGNYLLPYYYYYPIFYDYYSTILNTVYCLLDNGGASCGHELITLSYRSCLDIDNLTLKNIRVFLEHILFTLYILYIICIIFIIIWILYLMYVIYYFQDNVLEWDS